MMQQYPTLYSIVRKKNQSVVDVLIRTRPLNILFRRALTGDKLRLWLELVSKVVNMMLPED